MSVSPPKVSASSVFKCASSSSSSSITYFSSWQNHDMPGIIHHVGIVANMFDILMGEKALCAALKLARP
jgi:hypothetical protein